MATPEDNVDKGLFEQDPHVDQLRPEPSAPPSDVVILEGLAGKSDREGWVRLYFNRTLTYYAEFRKEDIVFTEAIPPEQGPMVGLKATRVGIKKDAVVEYTRTTRAKAADEFDLDVQLGAAGTPGAALRPPDTRTPCGDTGTCDTCLTCDTCRTRCNQPTCPQTQCQTCRTCQTCQTCQTCPDQGTCQTCQTNCNQRTCQITCTCETACQTCNTCRPTECGGGCFTRPASCWTDCRTGFPCVRTGIDCGF
jgi:hypothetical protein